MSQRRRGPMAAKQKYSNNLVERLRSGAPVSLADLGPQQQARQQGGRKVFIGRRADVDPAQRAELNKAQATFLTATNRREKLDAARWVIEELMIGNGAKGHFLEMPVPCIIVAEINDLLAGRSSRLFQKIDLPPGQRPPKNTGRAWLAVMGILLCARIVQRVDGVGLEKALHKAVTDIETDLHGPLDCYLPTGETNDDTINGDISARDARHARWVKRLVKDDPKLRAQNTMAGSLYGVECAGIEATPVDDLVRCERYRFARGTTVNMLRAAKDDDDDLLRQKGGKMLDFDE